MGENQPCTLPGDEIQKHYEDHEKLSFRFVRQVISVGGSYVQ
ncbi:hypothetical protein ACSU64_24665 [Bacillaceae bacterium C204]